MLSSLPTLAAHPLRRLSVVLALLGGLGGLLLVNAQPAAAAVPYDQVVSFESKNYPGRYVRHRDWLGELTPLWSDLDRQDATFIMRAGLTGAAGAVSFESANYRGYYLRHQGWRIKLAASDGSQLFRQDATFTARDLGYDEWKFESVNFPGHFIRHSGFQLWLNKADGSALFDRDSTWHRKPAANGTQGRGECTDWALYKRPDLAGTVSGNAQEWTEQARRAGRPVSKTPSERAVMVLQGGVMGAGATTGHVAYVERVQRDAYGNPTSFVVSEQNWNGNRYPTSRTIQVWELPPSGVDFIY
jgi:Alpha-L-arabinofuranosidase B (ABFB) domain/CHAP domain